MKKYNEEELSKNPRNLCAFCGKISVRKVGNNYQHLGWYNIGSKNDFKR